MIQKPARITNAAAIKRLGLKNPDKVAILARYPSRRRPRNKPPALCRRAHIRGRGGLSNGFLATKGRRLSASGPAAAINSGARRFRPPLDPSTAPCSLDCGQGPRPVECGNPRRARDRLRGALLALRQFFRRDHPPY